MKFAAMIMAVSLVIPPALHAAVTAEEYCTGEENALGERVARQCGTVMNLLNPSGCITARKNLAAFDKGSCLKLAMTRDASASPAKPPTKVPDPATHQPVPTPPRQDAPAPSGQQGSVELAAIKPVPVQNPEQAGAAKGDQSKTAPGTDIERLKAENRKLAAEIERLRAEIEQLRRK